MLIAAKTGEMKIKQRAVSGVLVYLPTGRRLKHLTCAATCRQTWQLTRIDWTPFPILLPCCQQICFVLCGSKFDVSNNKDNGTISSFHVILRLLSFGVYWEVEPTYVRVRLAAASNVVLRIWECECYCLKFSVLTCEVNLNSCFCLTFLTEWMIRSSEPFPPWQICQMGVKFYKMLMLVKVCRFVGKVIWNTY
jgi:hypothetical protein